MTVVVIVVGVVLRRAYHQLPIIGKQYAYCHCHCVCVNDNVPSKSTICTPKHKYHTCVFFHPICCAGYKYYVLLPTMYRRLAAIHTRLPKEIDASRRRRRRRECVFCVFATMCVLTFSYRRVCVCACRPSTLHQPTANDARERLIQIAFNRTPRCRYKRTNTTHTHKHIHIKTHS